ncbi:hypothetical protein GOACH_16_00680 [Gordonia aichiensis NBRC 108223]|uniref:SAV-6107-like HEPN domain-containing protein n=2 Tax=Gordonia aichiensis TaxID=36820 RepID=L7KMF3_9ACTN|nr:hypothetical protein GOACH_16_00680 [Gordonia aichiensis NBRC 108223]
MNVPPQAVQLTPDIPGGPATDEGSVHRRTVPGLETRDSRTGVETEPARRERDMAVRRPTRGTARHARRGATVRPEIDPVVVVRARDLLERAEILVENADGVPDDAERFRQYYLAALRAAGAALAVYEPPTRRASRRVSPNAWSRISSAVPELADFAGAFARLSTVRMDIESGLRRSVEGSAVTGLRARVLSFLDAVEGIVVSYEQGKLSHQSVDRSDYGYDHIA